MFKRRVRRGWLTWLAHFFYPPGGWGRAASYVAHRLRRLPDTPEKIARGFAAGVFVSFTPFFGFHFLMAAIVNVFVRGNLLASLLGTFVGNPLTFPLIATASLETGAWLTGTRATFGFRHVVDAFGNASVELWRNVKALFTADVPHWQSLHGFYDTVFFPYLVGGLLPGIAASVVGYLVARPIIAAYQKRRRRKLAEKWARLKLRHQPDGSDILLPDGNGADARGTGSDDDLR